MLKILIKISINFDSWDSLFTLERINDRGKTEKAVVARLISCFHQDFYTFNETPCKTNIHYNGTP